LVCVYALLIRAAAGSTFEPQISGYVHRAWTVEQGLPQNIVGVLHASRDGYLWIGASNGIVRFDGLSFTVFDLTNTPALTSNRIGTFHEGTDGTLWIGTSKGVVRYAGGVFTREDGDGQFSDDLITAICPGADGRLLAASAERIYLRETSGRWVVLPIEGAKAGITAMVTDRHGSTWIATGRQVIEWRGRTLRTLTARDGLPDAPVTALAKDRAGRLWIGTARGLARLDSNGATVVAEDGSLATWFVSRLLVDGDGALWIGSIGRLATRTPDGHVAVHAIANPAEDAPVVAFAQDAARQVWYGVGGGSGGLHRLAPRRLTSYTRTQGLPCDNIGPVAAAADGTIWLGTLCSDGGGLAALRDGRVQTYDGQSNAPAHVSALLPLPEGDLLIGTYRSGLFRFMDGRFTSVPGPFRFGVSIINALYRDHEEGLWVGMSEGLARYHRGEWRTWRVEDGLGSNDVRTIVGGADRSIWIGTGLGVTRYQHGRFISYGQAQGLPPGEVRALYVDEDDALWIGTYGGGLARMKDGRVTRYRSYGGLLDASVHRIIEDDQGYFWMSGDRGIRRVSRRELAAIANGERSAPRVDIFDTADGMTNAECNGMGQPAGARTADGALWFPSQAGLVRLDPAMLSEDMPAPSAAIESVRVNGVEQPNLSAITMSPGTRDLEIQYATPSLVRAEQVQYKYRLLGHDEAWVDAGTRRFAHFANLAPGDYQFEVSARNGAGRWRASAASVRLVLQPRLYQRLAFIVPMGSLLLFGLVVGIRLRLRQAGRRAERLEAAVAERTRELHAEREALRAAKGGVETAHTRLLATFNQLRVGVVLVDGDARVRFLSEAMRPLLGGVSSETAISQRIDRVLPIAPDSMAAIAMQLRSPQAGVRVTAELTPHSGQQYWTEIEVHADLGDPGQRVLHFYDITETVDLKRALQTAPRAAGADLLGDSVAMRDLRHQIARIATLGATVMIEGETGTGKELVAHAIHDASPRKHKPFVAINCAGLTESLLASQLFGHRRGAFTGAVTDHIGLFEAAHGGTLLLDEIGDMPMSVQTHLLRVLEERQILRLGDAKPRPIDVRLLTATHRDLDGEVAAGRFREDLLYRIRVVRLRLPALRMRADDIPLLAAAFLRSAREQHGLQVEGISREAMQHLQAQRWPGNVRQLKTTIEGAAIRAAGPVIKLTDINAELPREEVPPATRAPLSERERRELLDVLHQTGGNRSAAARALGMGRSTLYRRLRALEAEGAELPPDPSTSS
jgi:DNA-binding NtrC family response regulator/ligand-binding sensor domain-containing protein